MLAGASLVHNIYKPDLTIPGYEHAEDERGERNGATAPPADGRPLDAPRGAAPPPPPPAATVAALEKVLESKLK